MKRISVFVLIIAWVSSTQISWAQLKVDDKIQILESINKLVGQGVKVSNVRIDCPSGKKRPYGYFTDNTGTLGLTDGLLITTGAATSAVGPNNSGSVGQGNSNNRQDSDLKNIIQNNEKQYDACVVQFDVEVFADTLTFDYVFGSEEYLEFIKDYHDVFGFFIAGPGIPGRVNLATIPGTQTPISVKNVNDATNSQYYIDNGTGATPFDNLFVQYDGFTKKLESKIEVIPCQVYSLKMAICDIKDDIYDAGIFIGGKSLKTKAPKLSFRYEHQKFPTAIEGCNSVFVKVTRQSRFASGVTFQLRYSGTASRDLDYGAVPDNITFLPGDTSKEFFIPILSDLVSDDRESLVIELLNPCPGLPTVDQLDIPIRETFDFDIPDGKICFGDTLVLNPSPDIGYEFTWHPADFLSCTFCPSPKTSPPSDHKYFAETRDIASGCAAKDSLTVLVSPSPTAGFSFEGKPDYTNLDVFFTNLSKDADTYSWTFGDGNGSAEFSPNHYYESGFSMDSVTYPIILYAINSALGCQDSAKAEVKIGNPFFLPNLITANNDQINDEFFVRGIQPEYWKLDIYDRWGKPVYKSSAYNLDWKGESVTGGIYFFKLQNPVGDRTFTGWLQVLK